MLAVVSYAPIALLAVSTGKLALEPGQVVAMSVALASGCRVVVRAVDLDDEARLRPMSIDFELLSADRD